MASVFVTGSSDGIGHAGVGSAPVRQDALLAACGALTGTELPR